MIRWKKYINHLGFAQIIRRGGWELVGGNYFFGQSPAPVVSVEVNRKDGVNKVAVRYGRKGNGKLLDLSFYGGISRPNPWTLEIRSAGRILGYKLVNNELESRLSKRLDDQLQRSAARRRGRNERQPTLEANAKLNLYRPRIIGQPLQGIVATKDKLILTVGQESLVFRVWNQHLWLNGECLIHGKLAGDS